MHDPKGPDILPTLHPPGTLYSSSLYWDLGAIWADRRKIYTEGALKDFEEADKKVKPFLSGTSLGELFTYVGARHRIVVARQRDRGYSIKSKTPYPSVAWVAECREPEKFAKAIAFPLRAAGFAASAQVSLKLVEVMHLDCKITGYRFEEVEKNRRYEQGTLFNFTPCFSRVGKFFIFSSTFELCKDLIRELRSEEQSSIGGDPADARHRFSWSALGEAVSAEKELIATELTLRHGGAVERVDEQIEALLRLLDRLGVIEASVCHSPGFQLELRAVYKK
jgi:hypothetical protein